MRAVKEFRPDIVNWWGMYGLSKLLLPLPQRWGIPDVHWVEHWWMISEYGSRGQDPAEFWSALWDGRWGPKLARRCWWRFQRPWW
jgi:glycogen synthase